jgi:hypothetical protein
MIEDFAGGYYRMEMDIQPVKSEPKIEQGVYDFINRELYTDSSADIILRVGFDSSIHFTPTAGSAMPKEVLALPESFIHSDESMRTTQPSNVFILKPEIAQLMGSEVDY